MMPAHDGVQGPGGGEGTDSSGGGNPGAPKNAKRPGYPPGTGKSGYCRPCRSSSTVPQRRAPITGRKPRGDRAVGIVGGTVVTTPVPADPGVPVVPPAGSSEMSMVVIMSLVTVIGVETG